MPFVIETHSLTRRFGNIAAVTGLDLRVPERSVYAFLGPNGAGKTTTVRMLLGLIRPDPPRAPQSTIHDPQSRAQRAAVLLFGQPFRRPLLARIGALVESPSLYAHLTGRENLEVVRRLTARPRSAIYRALDTVRLTGAAGRLVSTYSLGMRHRLGLAIALLGDPDLLILDEPTNGLDPAGIREMRELIRRLPAERGATVFLSSHLLAEVEQVATHVGIIDQGRLLFQGALAELHSRMRPRLEIETDRPDAAADVLAEAGIALDGADAALAARANALLVSGGFSVHHLALRAPTLEEIFLSVTNGAS